MQKCASEDKNSHKQVHCALCGCDVYVCSCVRTGNGLQAWKKSGVKGYRKEQGERRWEQEKDSRTVFVISSEIHLFLPINCYPFWAWIEYIFSLPEEILLHSETLVLAGLASVCRAYPRIWGCFLESCSRKKDFTTPFFSLMTEETSVASIASLLWPQRKISEWACPTSAVFKQL